MRQQTRPFLPTLWPMLFVFLPVVLFGTVLVYPMLRGTFLAFSSAHGESFSPNPDRLSLNNFRFLLSDRLFWLAAANTFGFALLVSLFQIPLALILAFMLRSIRSAVMPFVRIALLSTHLVGGVFVGLMFLQIVSPSVRSAASFDVLSDPRFTLLILCTITLWTTVGITALHLQSAMRSIDPALYDSARIDGASGTRQFWHVTLPAVRGTACVLWLAGIIASAQLFELPFVLYSQTAGPRGSALTLVMYLFQTGFASGDLRYAAAIAWVMMLLLLVVSVAFVRVSGLARTQTN